MAKITPDLMIYQCLDTNGDGTGTTAATGDYSLAAEEFYITPGAAKAYSIARMIISLGDTATMQAQEYGNLGAALTNGITVKVDDGAGTELKDLTGGLAVQTNADWGRLCYDVDIKNWGAGNELLVARWTFERSGKPLLLEPNHRLVVNLNDSFTGLLSHTFFVQGFRA